MQTEIFVNFQKTDTTWLASIMSKKRAMIFSLVAFSNIYIYIYIYI